MRKKQQVFVIDPDLIRYIEEKALRTGTNKSQIIRDLIKADRENDSKLDENDKRMKLITKEMEEIETKLGLLTKSIELIEKIITIKKHRRRGTK